MKPTELYQELKSGRLQLNDLKKLIDAIELKGKVKNYDRNVNKEFRLCGVDWYVEHLFKDIKDKTIKREDLDFRYTINIENTLETDKFTNKYKGLKAGSRYLRIIGSLKKDLFYITGLALNDDKAFLYEKTNIEGLIKTEKELLKELREENGNF